MRRSLALLVPLALALTLAAAGVAFAGGAAAQQTQDNETTAVASYENATNYLTLVDDVRASDYATAGMDVGLEVGMDGRELQSTHQLRTFRSRLEAATTDANRSAAYEATLASLEERSDELIAQTNGLTASHAQGSIEPGTLLRERAAISAEASQLQEILTEIETIGQDSLAYDLPDRFTKRIRIIQGNLAILQGPVSEHASRLAAAGTSSENIYVESSSTGYSFALVDGTTYIRETYLGEEYDPTIGDQIAAERDDPLGWTHEHMKDLYDASNPDGSDILSPAGIYEYRASFESGDMTAYMHGGTTNVFRDGMELNASMLPVSDTEEASNGTTVMSVNRTFETGPMEVSLRDSTSGDPIEATVTIDGHQVGETGADGTLWAVEPREDVTVEATTAEGETVTLTV